MNLLIRLFLILIFSKTRSVLNLFDVCRTGFRVVLTDLDVLGHMNNGKYASLMDLGRVDYLIRTGMGKVLRARGWYPVVVSEHLRFRRSLKFREHFEIETQLLGWNEKHFFIEQRFLREQEVVALALVRGRFLSNKGEMISPQQLISAMNYQGETPTLPSYVHTWIEADEGQYQAGAK